MPSLYLRLSVASILLTLSAAGRAPAVDDAPFLPNDETQPPTRVADRSIVFGSEMPAPQDMVVGPPAVHVDLPEAPAMDPCQPDCGWCRHGFLGGCCLFHCRVDPAVPFGAALNAHMDTQIANGDAARLVLYRYDFHDGPNRAAAATLNRYGDRRLRRLMPLLECTASPLIIQEVPGQPDISEARRMHVLNRLSALLQVPISDQRVVVGEPPVPGLHGREALEIDKTMLQQTRTQGGVSAGGQGTQGSTLTTSGVSIGQP